MGVAIVIPTGLLQEIGVALFGPNWVAPLAAALRVREDTVRTAAEGRSFLKARFLNDLEQIAIQRGQEVAHILERIRAAK